METKVIRCAQHDHIEIACLYSYQVTLNLVNGRSITGQVETTLLTADRKECLILKNENRTQQVELITIKSMLSVTPNPHFDSIEF